MHTRTLGEFSAAIGAVEAIDGSVEVTELAYDTHTVQQGSLFFCLRGSHVDGHALAPDAAAAGAAALVVEERVDVPLPQLVVRDSRAAMAPAAKLFFDDPTAGMDVAGVTGTNGKTTTAFLLRAILGADPGRSVGLLTNIERRVGGERVPLGLNTPEAIDLFRLFREMRDGGDDAVVMEATSIAQAQHRLDEVRFDVLVFTNLTQDHLDYHGSMEAYFQAKRALFEQADRAVVNVADEYGRRLAADFPHAIAFDASSDALDGIRLRLRGAFNRLNAIGAALAARELGVPEPQISRGLESVAGVPGRFESIDEGQPFDVIVDYAHTPDSLENVLRAARDLASGDVIVVFGAGGDRDRAKRPLMGDAAAAGARFAILTSDNPRSEDPEAIIREVQGGRTNDFHVEVDRRQAIERALGMAAQGDVVVIAGRGAEPEQELASGKVPFDDRQVVRELLKRL